MPPIEAELRRRDSLGALQDWRLRDPLPADGGLHTDPVSDLTAHAKLQSAVDKLTDAVAALLDVANRFDAVQTATATYTTAGTYVLVDPPAGQAVRAVWIYLQAKGSVGTGTVLVTATLGTKSYQAELTGSQPFAHSAVWEGAANENLTITTDSNAAVIANCDYRLFTP